MDYDAALNVKDNNQLKSRKTIVVEYYFTKCRGLYSAVY